MGIRATVGPGATVGRSRSVAGMTKRSLHLPTPVTVALSVVAGILSLLNLTTFGFAAPWQNLVTIGLAALAAVGIAPLTGPALQNAIHLSHAAALSLASGVSALAVAITTLSIDQTVKGILTGVLTLAAGVLFGPAVPSVLGPKPAPVVAPGVAHVTPSTASPEKAA